MDLQNHKDLLKFIDQLRKKGVTRFKSGEIELELSPDALFPESDYKKKKSLHSDSKDLPISQTPYTDEEILNWSSAGIAEAGEGAH